MVIFNFSDRIAIEIIDNDKLQDIQFGEIKFVSKNPVKIKIQGNKKSLNSTEVSKLTKLMGLKEGQIISDEIKSNFTESTKTQIVKLKYFSFWEGWLEKKIKMNFSCWIDNGFGCLCWNFGATFGNVDSFLIF